MSFFESVRIFKEYTQKYTKMLQEFGYQDVHVKIARAIPQVLDSMEAYFWRKNYGYDFSISSNKDVTDYDEIFGFVKYWAVLQQANIPEVFTKYLSNKGYSIAHISVMSRNDWAQFSVVKDEIRYNISLYRVNAETAQEENLEDDEPLEFSDEEIADSKKVFEKLLGETLKISEYDIEISTDMAKTHIIVCYHYVKYTLDLRCYRLDLSWPEVETIFCDAICCFWTDREADKDYSLFCGYLQRNFFHICDYIQEGDLFHIHAYREGTRLDISAHMEILPGHADTQKIDFDHMDGHAFEHFCAKVLLKNGFEDVQVTQGSGDQGVDIIAYKDSVKYGIQCKCYSGDIGNKAVQEALAGRIYYNCHVGVVLTNRYFTKAAMDLSRSSGIILWNRDKLTSMVENLTKNSIL